MELSIIIVSYNTKDLLKQCLESLVGGVGEVEVVVVDNGSEDGSVEMVKKFSMTIDQFSIKLIKNKENLGFAKAVDQALRQVYTERDRSAQGKAILLLNSDTQVKSGALEKLLEFEEKVRPAIIGARLLNPDSSVQPSVFNLPTVKRAILEYWFGKTGEFSKYALEGDEPVEVEAVVGGAMLISREIIEKIGFFDERYFMYFEDLDYCRRARKAGFRIWYLPTAEIIHEHGASGKTLISEEEQWKRLIPSSKIYHGWLKHYLINLILWVSQKFR